MALKAVIFDMDGVLLDTVEYHYRSWKKICQEMGIPFSREENDKLRGRSRRDSLELLLGGWQLSAEETDRLIKQKNVYFRDEIERSASLALLPGVDPLLQEIARENIPAGVASSSRNAAFLLEHLHVTGYFEIIADGTSVKKLKPAPDIYQFAASNIGVSPQECVVLEDAAAGIQAAKSAGMCVVGIGPWERVQAADAVQDDLCGITLSKLRQIHEMWQNNGRSQ